MFRRTTPRRSPGASSGTRSIDASPHSDRRLLWTAGPDQGRARPDPIPLRLRPPADPDRASGQRPGRGPRRRAARRRRSSHNRWRRRPRTRPGAARRRVDLRNRVDHQDVHRNDSGGHGRCRRGQPVGAGGPPASSRGQGAFDSWPRDHPARPGDPHFGPSDPSDQFRPGQSCQSLCRLHHGTAGRVPGRLCTSPPAGSRVPVLESRIRPAGHRAGPPGRADLRRTGDAAGSWPRSTCGAR